MNMDLWSETDNNLLFSLKFYGMSMKMPTFAL